MQDRVSQYPGRIKLVPVSGQENVYDMEWADGATVEGTALNKANFLADATATSLGLTSAATPNDAFGKLQENILDERPEIGEIRATAETSLGSNWLLCNGAQITSSQYSQLYNLLSSDLRTRFSAYNISTGESTPLAISVVTYINNRFVIVSRENKSSGSYESYGVFITSSSNGTSWTTEKVYEDGNAFYVTGIAYAGGKYVISLEYIDSGQGTINPTILYGTSLTGTFTAKIISGSGSYRTSGFSVAAKGSYFILHGSVNEGSSSSANYTSVIWVLNASSLSTTYMYAINWGIILGQSPSSIMVLGNYWVLYHGGILRYTTTAAPSSVSNWSIYNMQLEDNSFHIHGGIYIGSRYILFSVSDIVLVSSGSSINSQYTLIRSVTGSPESKPTFLAVVGNTALATNEGGRAAIATAPFTSWTKFNLPSTSSGRCASNGDIVITLMGTSTSAGVIQGNRAYGRTLPTISPDKSRAFIKARSGK